MRRLVSITLAVALLLLLGGTTSYVEAKEKAPVSETSQTCVCEKGKAGEKVWCHKCNVGYIDGKKVAGLTSVTHEDRLGKNPAVRIKNNPLFSCQLGSLNSGLHPFESIMDELRISRIARYNKDFKPSETEFELDKHTTALFHFSRW